MEFKKEDLAGKYVWDSGRKESFSGEATRRLFDPYIGEQVLFLINLYALQHPGFTVEDGRLIEQRITNDLPSGNHSEVSVLAYLKNLPLRESPDEERKQVEFIHYTNSGHK